MAWSSTFDDKLRSQRHGPIWYIQTNPGSEAAYGTNFAPDQWQGSTHRRFANPCIVNGSMRFEPSGVSSRFWQSSIGGFSFDILSDVDPRTKAIGRGTRMTVYLAFDGDITSDIEPVARGVVDTVTRRSGVRWTVTCKGPLYMLNSRYRTDADATLFHDLPSSASISGGAWATGGYPSTLTVTSTTGYLDPATMGHVGVLAVGDDPTTAGWFAYTAKTGTTFTISGVYYGSPTVPGSYPNGTAVTQVAHYRGHPCDVMQRIFTTTGLGTNGTADKYLAPMGLGIPSSWWDSSDSALFKAIRSIAGTYEMAFNVFEPVDDSQTSSLNFMLDLFGRLGYWPVLRQGLISCHTARPLDTGWPGVASPFKLKDSDIFQVEQFDWFDPQTPNEYRVFGTIYHRDAVTGVTSVKINSAGDPAGFRTLPAGDSFYLDVTDAVDSSTTTDADKVAQEVADTVGTWYNRTPRKIVVLARGWIWAGMSPGDWVDVTSTRIGSPDDEGSTYEDQHCCLMEITPFVGPYTRLVLATA
jgi:hypothetical protein